MGESLTDEELKEMLEEADRSGDGEVNQDDFLRIMKKTSLYWFRRVAFRINVKVFNQWSFMFLYEYYAKNIYALDIAIYLVRQC